MSSKEKIKLSISILMSGRKETRDCLESLVPLMEAIPCELILVDTGCDKEKRAILEEYTDMIIDFEWCNDFSKARNVGLEKATGEWFMFMDDDEWFEDTSEIIEFFKSGEYKKYESANYIVRNYSDKEGKNYTDAALIRMTKMNENTRFKCSIHEHLAPLCYPCKSFSSYVHHYGYVYNSREELFSDSKRNLTLLKETLKKEPDNFRMAALTLQEYKRLGEYDNMLEFAKEYVNKCNDKKYKNVRMDLNLSSFYAAILESHECKYEYNEMLEFIDEIIKDKRINDVIRAYIYRAEAIASYCTEDYSRCVKAFYKYMDIYNVLGNDMDKAFEQMFAFTYDTFNGTKFKSILYIGIMASLKQDDETILKEYFDLLEWNEEEVYVHIDFIKVLMKYVLSKENCEDYSEYIEKVIRRKSGLYRVVGYVRDIEDKIDGITNDAEDEDNNQEDEDNDIIFNRGIRLLSCVESNYWYYIYARVLNYKNNKDKELCLKNMGALFGCIIDKFNINNRIWKIAAEVGVTFDMVAGGASYNVWIEGVQRWIEHAELEDVEYKAILNDIWNGNQDYRYKYFDTKVKEGLVRTINKEEIDFDILESRIFDFAHSTYNYYVYI